MTRIRNWAEHRWAQPRLSAYVDGDLAPHAHRRMRRHANDCPECGPALRSLIRVVHSLVGKLSAPRNGEAAKSVVASLVREAPGGGSAVPDRRR